MPNATLSLPQARRLSLRAQGFGQTDATEKTAGAARAAGADGKVSTPGWRQLKKQLQTMGNLQIDAINTVIRSHYTPLYSRLGPYDRTVLDHHVFRPRRVPGNRAFFEYWGHECSVLPVDYYPLFRWRMDDARAGAGMYKQLKQLAQKKPAFVRRIREQLREQPMTCREIGVDRRGPGMWEWSESKQALEYLFWTGQLASVGRRNFQRVYALPEAVIPERILNAAPRSRVDAQAMLLEIAATAMGVATETDLRDYFRLSAVDGARALQQLLDEHRLEPVNVRGWNKTAYRRPGTVVPRKLNTSTLLSPFDPVVWCRERASRLFDFNYRIEIYVPEAKRQYGYWVMPYLLDDRVVARLDLKADREAQQLLVKGAWSEASADISRIARPLHAELERLAHWLGLNDVKIARKGDLGPVLRKLAVSA